MRQRQEKIILFVSTGNYYRSRFAEFLFNSVAGKMRLPWRAPSRGLTLEATTHHGAIDLLREVAPKTTIHADRRFVDNGRVVCSAGSPPAST